MMEAGVQQILDVALQINMKNSRLSQVLCGDVNHLWRSDAYKLKNQKCKLKLFTQF